MVVSLNIINDSTNIVIAPKMILILAYNTLMDSSVVISCFGFRVSQFTGLRFEGAGMLIVVSSVAVCCCSMQFSGGLVACRFCSCEVAASRFRVTCCGFRVSGSCWFVSVQVLSLGVDRGLTIPGYRMNGL